MRTVVPLGPYPLVLTLVLASCGQQGIAPESNSTNVTAQGIGGTEVVSGGIYRLTNTNSNLVLEVDGVSRASEANVQVWTKNDGAHQSWKIEEVGSGFATLQAQHSGLCLDVQGGGTTSGTDVQQYACNKTNAQQWKLVSLGDGVYKLLSGANSALALDVFDGGVTNGTDVQLYNDNGTGAQKWKLERLDASSGDGGSSSNPIKTTYTASSENFPNPERGILILWQTTGSNTSVNNPEEIQSGGVLDYFKRERARVGTTTVRIVYNLGAWREAGIPSSFLDRIERDFAALRSSGFKAIPYFTYAWVLDQDNDAARDASTQWIVHHTQQLKPVLERNKDVLALMFAGLVGAWGEWHHSSSGNLGENDEVNDNSREIFKAIVGAVPVERSVAVRYTSLKRTLLGEMSLAAEERFSGTARARTGFHDEALLQNLWGSDVYASWYDAYIRAEGPYVPNVEAFDSNAVKAGTSITCAQMYRELARRGADFTNDVEGMERIESGCAPEVRRRVGYRYRLVESEIPTSVKRGGSLNLSIKVTNDGWASAYNPRAVEVILRNNASGQTLVLTDSVGSIREEDPRFWLPGETHSVTVSGYSVPSDLAAGEYEVLLNLPDPMPSLHDRAEYSIRLANQNTWEASTGYNKLLRSIHVQ